MCDNGKCLNIFTLRTGCLILGFTSVTIWGFSLAAFASTLIANPEIRKDTMQFDMRLLYEIVIRLIIVFSVLFSFSVTLLFGIYKNQRGLLRAYYVHGIVKIVAIGIIVIAIAPEYPPAGLALIGACIVYALLLRMVRLEYQTMTSVHTDVIKPPNELLTHVNSSLGEERLITGV